MADTTLPAGNLDGPAPDAETRAGPGAVVGADTGADADADAGDDTDTAEETGASGEVDAGFGEAEAVDEELDDGGDVLADARGLFAVVREELETKRSVGWEKAGDSFRAARRYFGSPEAMLFLQNCFFEVVSILLDQQAAKITPHQRSCVEAALVTAVELSVDAVGSGSLAFLDTLCALFDRDRSFYRGTKTYWNSVPGAPQVRLRCIRCFAENGGFEKLGEELAKPPATWIGAGKACVLVRAAIDGKEQVAPAASAALAELFMAQAAKLDGDALRKDSTEAMSHLLQNVQEVLDAVGGGAEFFDFWLGLTLRYLRVDSLPLRLFGWDQVTALMEHADEMRPVPRRIEVSGAGAEEVNGIYQLREAAPRGNPSYTLTTPSRVLLTLFRCTMRSTAKWWYISEADPKDPGSDKDIDYYQHKSKAHEEREPPATRWLSCTGTKQRGADPPPKLRVLELDVDPGKEEDLLQARLVRWLLENDVVGSVFRSSSAHREVVSRSAQMLRFLADQQALTATHLEVVWSTAVAAAEAETVEEVYALLMQLMGGLSVELLEALLGRVRETLGLKTRDAAIGFLRRLARDQASISQVAQQMPPAALRRLITLLWHVMSHRLVATWMDLGPLLNACLGALGSEAEKVERAKLLQECLEVLRRGTVADSMPDDAALETSLSLLSFLLRSAGKTLDEKAALLRQLNCGDETLPDVLQRELVTFRTRARRTLGDEDEVLSVGSPCNTDGGSAGEEDGMSPAQRAFHRRLELRLKMLRFVYGLAADVQWDFDTLLQLWDLLDAPRERDMLMQELRDAAQPTGGPAGLLPAFDGDVASRIFRELLCDRATWADLGLAAYACFKAFFDATEAPAGDSMDLDTPMPGDPENVGLATLWHILLTTRTEAVAEAARDDLLRAHAQLDASTGPATPRVELGAADTIATAEGRISGTGRGLLDMVFTQLRLARERRAVTNAERLVDVLRGALRQNAGLRPLAHGARSTAGRVALLPVMVKRTILGGHGYGGTEPLEPEPVRVHPLLPLRYLCEHLGRMYNHRAELVRIFRVGPLRNLEVTISEAGLVGADFSVHLIAEHQAGGSGSGGVYSGNYTRWSSGSPDAFDLDATDPADTHLASVIANDLSYIEVLFDVLQTMGPLSGGLAREFWALLLSIPTNPSLEAMVRRALAPVPPRTEGAPDWPSLLNEERSQRSLYIMQIVDAHLNPSPEVEALEDAPAPDACCRAFTVGGGLSAVLTLFLRPGANGTATADLAAAVRGHAAALRILRACLFGRPPEEREDSGDGASDAAPLADALTPLLREFPLDTLLHKLIEVAVRATDMVGGEAHATTNGEGPSGEGMDLDTQGLVTSTLTSALATLALLLRSEGTVQAFCGAPGTQQLVTRTLVRYPDADVRAHMAYLLTSAGRGAGLVRTVLPWVIEELRQLPQTCETAEQLFNVLLWAVCRGADGVIEATTHRSLAQELLRKLASFASGTDREGPSLMEREGTTVLEGCLRTLSEVLSRSAAAIDETILGSPLVSFVFEKGLFSMPERPDAALGGEQRGMGESFCRHPKERVAAFKLLLEASRTSPRMLAAILEHVEALLSGAVGSLVRSWNVEMGGEEKLMGAPFVGLKNQGCTCYMNSLLQQLFMVPSVRHAVLRARVRRSRRQMARFVKDPEELVNRRLVFAVENGKTVEGVVAGFDPPSGMHRVRYANHGEHAFRLREGRLGRETGDFWFADDGGDAAGPVGQVAVRSPSSEGDGPDELQESLKKRAKVEGGQKLLEQIQRTFAFLQSSEKRYFDPRLLVEACRVLNLQYSVYQQNDAAEFCNTLLDHLEEALKFSSRDQIRELERSFGGKVCYQKLPRDCDHRKNTLEAFKTIELIIRGKTSIEESLEAFVEGELMDGDNKVECDGCGEKRACIRRTCIEARPNVLILHLKRFDLDFTTFETVKINSLCRFPIKLNLKRYTRVGIEEAERREAAEAGEDDGAPPAEELDDADFDYELKGVLVHAGVAQGGHYYSFIADRQRQGWFRFDDEDATPFDASHIATQCFGGTYTRGNTTWTSAQEHERIANALMLFYEKVRPNVEGSGDADATTRGAPGDAAGEMRSAGTGTATPAAGGASGASGADGLGAAGAGADAGASGGMRVGSGADTGAGAGGDAGGGADMGGEAGAEVGAETGPPGNAEPNGHAENDGDFFPLEDGAVEMTGYEAFEEEVLASNLAFMRQKYVFDDALQEWLRELLITVGTWEAGGAEPKGSDAGGKRRLLWQGVAIAEAAAVQRHTAQLGASYFFDCLLHARDTRSVKGWVKALTRVFRALPAAALDLFSSLSEPAEADARLADGAAPRRLPAGWLRQYFGEAVTGVARSFAAQLFAGAATDLARAQGLPDAQAAPALPLPLHGFLQAVKTLVEATATTIRNIDELMVLIRDLAAVPVVRRALVELDLPATLVYLALSAMDRAPPEMRQAFAGVVVPPATNLSYVTLPGDLMFLVEAVAALCGGRSLPRRPELMVDGELSPEAAAALRRVFRSETVGGAMDPQDIAGYLERVGTPGSVAGVVPPPMQIKSLLARYHTLQDGRLSERGFLEYYTETATRSPKQVWQDLQTFAFDANLEHQDDVHARRMAETLGPNGGGFAEAGGSAFDEMPDSSTQAILQLDFLDVAHEADAESTRTIVREVGRSNLETAKHLARVMLGTLYAAHAPHSQTWGMEELYQNRVELLAELVTAVAARSPASPRAAYGGEAMEEEQPAGEGHGDADLVASTDGARGPTTAAPGASERGAGGVSPLDELIDYMMLDPQVGVISSARASVERSMGEAELAAATTPSEVAAALQLALSSADWKVQTKVQRRSEVLRTLAKTKPVNAWLQVRRELWVWMSTSWRRHNTSHGYSRSTYSPGEGDAYDGGVGGDSDESDDNYADDPPQEIHVKGAGSTEVNGVYTLTPKVVDDVPVWTKLGLDPVTGARQIFHLYRCKLTTGAHRWYISVPPEDQNPGTTKDVDYYYAGSRVRLKTMTSRPWDEASPPLSRWEVVQSHHQSAMPAPRLEIPRTNHSPSPSRHPGPSSPNPGAAGSDSEVEMPVGADDSVLSSAPSGGLPGPYTPDRDLTSLAFPPPAADDGGDDHDNVDSDGRREIGTAGMHGWAPQASLE